MNVSVNISVNLTCDAAPSVFDVWLEVIFSALYTATGIAGLLGNILVLLIVGTSRTLRGSVTNFLIGNMAISDLVLIATSGWMTPVILLSSDYNWPFGEVGCRTYQVFGSLGFHVSSYTLLIIALDRYVIIIHPFSNLTRLRQRRIYLVMAVGLIWTSAIALTLPLALNVSFFLPMPEICPEIGVCVESGWSEHGQVLYGTLIFFCKSLLPFAIITYSCLTIRHYLNRVGQRLSERNKRHVQSAEARKESMFEKYETCRNHEVGEFTEGQPGAQFDPSRSDTRNGRDKNFLTKSYVCKGSKLLANNLKSNRFSLAVTNEIMPRERWNIRRCSAMPSLENDSESDENHCNLLTPNGRASNGHTSHLDVSEEGHHGCINNAAGSGTTSNGVHPIIPMLKEPSLHVTNGQATTRLAKSALEAKSSNPLSAKRYTELERNKCLQRVLLAMFAMYGLCSIPLDLMSLIMDLDVTFGLGLPETPVKVCQLLSHLLAITATVWNPLLYAWMNSGFREHFGARSMNIRSRIARINI